jgi:hypothetical protein
MHLLTGPEYNIIYAKNMILGTKTIIRLQISIKGTWILLQKSNSKTEKILLGYRVREIVGLVEANIQGHCQRVSMEKRFHVNERKSV